jgi:outer membrane receptor protein involved in Fe transport
VDAPLSDSLTAHFSGIGRYTSAYDFFPGAQGLFNYAHQDGYALINISGHLQKDFTAVGGLRPRYVRLGFFVNNLTDKKYYALRTSQAFIGLLDVAAPPRTYGLRFGVGF